MQFLTQGDESFPIKIETYYTQKSLNTATELETVTYQVHVSPPTPTLRGAETPQPKIFHTLWRLESQLAYGELANKPSTRTCPLYFSEQAGNEDRGQRVSTTVAINKQDESNDERRGASYE